MELINLIIDIIDGIKQQFTENSSESQLSTILI